MDREEEAEEAEEEEDDEEKEKVEPVSDGTGDGGGLGSNWLCPPLSSAAGASRGSHLRIEMGRSSSPSLAKPLMVRT